MILSITFLKEMYVTIVLLQRLGLSVQTFKRAVMSQSQYRISASVAILSLKIMYINLYILWIFIKSICIHVVFNIALTKRKSVIKVLFVNQTSLTILIEGVITE